MPTPLSYRTLIPDLLSPTVAFVPRKKMFAAKSIQRIPLAEAKERFGGVHWSNSLWHHESESIELSATDRKILLAAVRASHALEKKMALTPLPKGLHGFEVVATQPINLGEWSLYTGRLLVPQDYEIDDVYATMLKNNRISARYHGNMTRYFSHAFTDSQLENEVSFNSKRVHNRVATANFERFYIQTSVEYFAALRATRNIQAGERLRSPYLLLHFDNQQLTPQLFSHSAALIKPRYYKWKNNTLSFKLETTRIYCDITLQEIIALEKTYVIRAEQSDLAYDLYIYPDFWEDALQQHTNWWQQHHLMIELSHHDQHHIKGFVAQKSLEECLYATLEHLLEESLGTAEQGTIPLNTTDSHGHPKTLMHVFILHASPEITTQRQHKLQQAGIPIITNNATTFYVPFRSLFYASNSLTQ